METIVSGIAAILTTVAFIPQAYKIIHSRETAGVSLWMHVTFAIGVAFWFALGIMLWNWPMMIGNLVTFALAVVIVIMKLYHGPRREQLDRTTRKQDKSRSAAVALGPNR